MCDFCVPEYIKEQRKVNAMIEKEMQLQKKLAEKDIKMLLLGTGESGKSTILKQMQLIHGAGYSIQEKKNYRSIIFDNIIQSMKSILENMASMEIPLSDPELEKQKSYVLEAASSLSPRESLSKELVGALIKLWADQGVATCFQRAREFQLNDSAKYYLMNMLRIGDADYIPTEQDILRSRVKTTGIIETIFRVKNMTYRMYDVAGQRSERRKWMSCFENVTAVIFLAAISEFDQVIAEDETTNRIVEALNVFKLVFNNKYFSATSMILFLNKIDLFKEKIEKGVKIAHYFDDYKGGQSYTEASQFFLSKFLACKIDDDPTRQIYAHFTCATDTSNVKVVMSAVNEILIRNALGNTGFI